MYRDEPIAKYLADAAAGIPAPGGGSVSALTGALGAAMACMASNFTIGKKKFRDVEPEAKALLGKFQAGANELLALVDRDVAAYTTVSAAYGLPKETEDEKHARHAAIQDALEVALAEPLATARQCLALLQVLDRLVEIANPSLISDVGVAAILLEAALRGAKINVEVNLKGLDNKAFIQETDGETTEAAFEASQIAASVVDRVYQKMGWRPS
jgi:formiminotetrahydrofolate cyclodeaminase